MEIKKSPKADLQNKRGLLLEIGLVAALVLVIGAFAYTPKEHRIEKIDMNYGTVEEQMTEITRNEQKPPEQPKKVEVQTIADMLQIVTNDTKLDNNFAFEDFDENTNVVQHVAVKEEVIEDDQPFMRVETMPSFQGGDINTFRKWVGDTLRFPQIALENGISGRVNVTFVIEKDGRLTNIKVISAPDRSLAEEAVRVLSKSPKWSPGKQRNQAVRVQYNIPIDFRVQQ